VAAVIGIAGGTGHYLLALAHRYAPASVLGPFLYQQIVWMVLLGYLVFGDLPDAPVVAGCAIVIASGGYLLWRERKTKTAFLIATRVEDGQAVIEVLDRGPGIPAADIERQKRPFIRLDGARSGAGSGLGLAIVERVARAHGGRLELAARDGGGLAARLVLALR